ncbi:hypothetical protein ABBQ32_009046 [Trebouxia sp. C0010 RCD-2024]
MTRSTPRRKAWWAAATLCAVLLLDYIAAASAAKTSGRDTESGDGAIPDAVAGPIVRAVVDRLKDANTTDALDKKKTIAQMIDEALEQEFPEEKEEKIGKNFNETAKNSDATVETVLKVSQKQQKDEEEDDDTATQDAATNSTLSPIPQTDTVGGNKAAGNSIVKTPAPSGSKQQKAKTKKVDSHAEKEVDRIIDSQDNEYVLSKPKSSSLGLTLDPQLIRDLTVLITSSTIAGMALEAVKQPVINGYFIAGSLVGPGGAGLIKELVQVESLAQVGVQLLLFTLGLEFSLQKLKAVRNVALIGGVLEIFLFILVAGLLANFIGASVHEGIFVGALVSMSSTSIVVKCLEDSRSTNMAHGQITIGTLILQDCLVGLLFAFMPVLAHSSKKAAVDNMLILRLLLKVTLTLGGCLTVAVALTRSVLPRSLRFLATNSSAELFQLTVLAFCLVNAWISGYLGLSSELGAFVAGVMLSSTDQQEHCLNQLTSIRHFFMSLFISTTGLVMSPRFLLQHLPVLAGGVLVCIICKTCLISGVVYMFGFPPQTALAVGLSMAQIGEFAFVLLSIASQLGLMPYQVYMLLMGVTALSLLITPFLMQASNKWLLLADPEAGTLMFKPPKLRKSGASSSDDGLPVVLPPDSKEVHPSGRGNTHLAQRNGATQNSNTLSPSGSQYPSETRVQQRYAFL